MAEDKQTPVSGDYTNPGTPAVSHSFMETFAKPSPSRSMTPEDEASATSNTISLDVLEAPAAPATNKNGLTPHQTGSYLGVSPQETDTSFDRNVVDFPELTQYEIVSYKEVDFGQREEFEMLLKKESSCARSCLHKGLVVNVFFLIVMVVGIILGEVLFPLEGVRGEGTSIYNGSECAEHLSACITVRVVRSFGIFGFLGGITNWIAIETLFRSVPFLIGTGVITKHYKEIRESILQIVTNTMFDPAALKQYFSGRNKSVREMLHLETHFGSLLDSEAANHIIERKIDMALARPEGFVLAMMGVDHNDLKPIMRRHIKGFISEISPTILDKMVAPGLTDVVGLQPEVERILEERVEELSAKKVNQLVAAMIRKHLSWLIVWGNLFGAIIGVLVEAITILVIRTKD